MEYKCPQCGHVSTEAGNCPMCNVPMQPVSLDASQGAPVSEPAPTTPVEPVPAAPAEPVPPAPPEEPASPATPPPPPPPPAA